MAIKVYKPTINSRRNMSVIDYSSLSKVAPEKSLLAPLNKKAGRNSYGRITVRHRGGGNRRKYRIIDFKRNKFDVALIEYTDGEKAYILAPEGLKVGYKVVSGENADIKIGNALPLTHIPVGTFVHNIELYPGRGAQLARSAGNMAQLMARENGYALLRLPSNELRNVPETCMATIGQVSNPDHFNVRMTTPTAVVRVSPLSAVPALLPPGVSPLSVTRHVSTRSRAISLSFAEETVSKAKKGA